MRSQQKVARWNFFKKKNNVKLNTKTKEQKSRYLAKQWHSSWSRKNNERRLYPCTTKRLMEWNNKYSEGLCKLSLTVFILSESFLNIDKHTGCINYGRPLKINLLYYNLCTLGLALVIHRHINYHLCVVTYSETLDEGMW